MRRAGRWIAVGLTALGRLVAVLSALFVAYGLWRLGDTGSFSPYGPPTTQNCTALAGGPLEDVALDMRTGQLFLALGEGGAATPPGLYTLNPVAADLSLQPVTPPGLTGFLPVGLGLYDAPDGTQMLFVVDRRPGGDRVETFDLTHEGLALRETISDPGFFALQDIVPVAPRHFYVTRSAAAEGAGPRVFEALLGLPVGAVLYFDGTLADPAARGLVTPRGLMLEGDELYVAEFLSHRLSVFKRDAKTGALAPSRIVDLPAMPLQINRGGDGALYAAAQPRLFRYFLHHRYAAARAPAEILKIADAKSEVVFSDDGTRLSSARAGLESGGVLIAGEDRGGTILVCR